MKGRVKFFNTSKGFGFIAGEDSKEYFVHVTALPPGTMLRDNDAVTFDITMGDRGPKASNVKLDKGNAPAAEAPEDDLPEDEGSDEEEEE